MIDATEARQRVRAHLLARYPSLNAAAEAMGKHSSQLSEVLGGKRPVPDWLLAEVGLRKERHWIYLEKQQ